MKKFATILGVAALLAMAATTAFAGAVRISACYGGGGNSGAVYNQDFVELFNASGVPVNIGGWSLQYGSATGTSNLGACTNCQYTFPANTIIAPCSYFLVGLATGTATNGIALPTLDINIGATAINMAGAGGKIGLVNGVTQQACAGTFEDLVGYGTANCSETLPVGTGAGFTNAQMCVRNGAGMTDTNNNRTDFAVVNTSGAFTPRNSASPANASCVATRTLPTTWGSLKSIYR
ncbi:MAG: lamin tail domain-containing protein [Candidatus Eisenbacteria bacterium]